MTDEIPMTPEGYERLSLELKKLKEVERPHVIEAIAEARAHGDLKENAEYHAAREQQGLIEARIKDLEGSLTRAKVIDFRGQTIDQVRLGAYVTIQDLESNDSKTYRIVSHLEADISAGEISILSPIAKVALGKSTGEILEVTAPKGIKEYEILEIRY